MNTAGIGPLAPAARSHHAITDPQPMLTCPKLQPFPGLDTSPPDRKQWVRFRVRVTPPPSVQPWAARPKFAQKMLPFISKLSVSRVQCDAWAAGTDLPSIE